jgi:hypothetical protein
VISDIVDVNASSGLAAYDGFALANVVEATSGGPAAYLEGGRFQMTYDFQRREGAATRSGILGQTIPVTVQGPEAVGPNHYAGSFATIGGTGALSGSFFAGGDVAAATAGGFALDGLTARGNPATAAGVFGADRVR